MSKIEKLTAQISDLQNLWYLMVSNEHHKDRDCHWSVETKWSYAMERPSYKVVHHGYTHGEVAQGFLTYEDALAGLLLELKKAIQNEYAGYKWALKHEYTEQTTTNFTQSDFVVAKKAVALVQAFNIDANKELKITAAFS